MIKINLASRKQAVATMPDEFTADHESVPKKSFDFTLSFDAIKNFPLRQIAVAIAVIGVGTYSLNSYKEEKLAELDKVIHVQEQETAKLNAELAKRKGYEEQKKALEADELIMRTKIETIQKLAAGRQNSTKMLVALSTGIPAETWLKTLKVGEDEVHLTGQANSLNQVSEFIKSMNESTYFTNLHLVGTKEEKPTGEPELTSFELSSKEVK